MKKSATIIITVIITTIVNIPLSFHLYSAFLDFTSQARIATLKMEVENMKNDIAEKNLQISELKKQMPYKDN